MLNSSSGAPRRTAPATTVPCALREQFAGFCLSLPLRRRTVFRTCPMPAASHSGSRYCPSIPSPVNLKQGKVIHSPILRAGPIRSRAKSKPCRPRSGSAFGLLDGHHSLSVASRAVGVEMPCCFREHDRKVAHRIVRPKSKQGWVVQEGITQQSREFAENGSKLYAKA